MIWFCFLVPPLLMALALCLDSLETRLLGRPPREDTAAAEAAPTVEIPAAVRRHRTPRTHRHRAPAPTGPRMVARLHSPR